MAYLLDTNIIIHARDGDEQVLSALADHDGTVVISALSLAELQRGLVKNSDQAALRATRLQILLDAIPIIPFDANAARIYGGIIAQCGWVRGRDFDRMIAATALSVAAILVTNNTADFQDIPGLVLADWKR